MRRAVVLVLALALLGCRADDREPTVSTTTTTTTTTAGAVADGPVPEGRGVVVTSITDGDTFRAGDERVRLIGIDTPEVTSEAECFGEEASAALEALIPVGTSVTLVSDVDTVDRYERTLAYVYRTDDGLDVNLRMAADGYALPLTVPPNVAREAAFADAAAEAREAGRGLWSACGDDTATTSAVPTTPPRDGSGSACDPSYPDVCIPPAPPDLDCADIPYRRFTVLPPDPHHFDGGGDGIGCESG